MSRVQAAFALLDSIHTQAGDLSLVEPKLKELLSAMEPGEVGTFVDEACKLAHMIKSGVPIIKKVLEDLANDLQRSLAQASALRQAVKVLEEKINLLMADLNAKEDKVLLGQAAYVLDAVAIEFVFCSDKRPNSCSIGTLRNLAADNELTEEQMQRWQQFKRYTSLQGWTVADLVGKTSELRTDRYPIAHGSSEQQEATTPTMLEAWVNKYYRGDDGMHRLLQIISKFTLPNKPLCKSPDSQKVIEKELNKELNDLTK